MTNKKNKLIARIFLSQRNVSFKASAVFKLVWKEMGNSLRGNGFRTILDL